MIVPEAEFNSESLPYDTPLTGIEKVQPTQTINTQSGGLAEPEPSDESREIADALEETPRKPKASSLESCFRICAQKRDSNRAWQPLRKSTIRR